MACAEAFLPVLVAGMRDLVSRDGGGEAGVAALLARIDASGDGNLAIQVMGPDAVDVRGHAGLLSSFVGPEAVWRIFCADCATACHLDAEVVLDMMVLLTMLTCGYLSARSHGSGAGQGDLAAELGPLYTTLTSGPGEGPDLV